MCQLEFIDDFFSTFFCFVTFILFFFLIRARPLKSGLKLMFLKAVAGCNFVIEFTRKVFIFFNSCEGVFEMSLYSVLFFS